MKPRMPAWRERWSRVRHTEVHESEYEPVQATARHPELKCPDAASRLIKLRSGGWSRMRLSAAFTSSALVVALHEDGTAQGFDFVRRGSSWESIGKIPQPHTPFEWCSSSAMTVTLTRTALGFVELPSLVVREQETPWRLKKSSVANWRSHPIIAAVSHDRSIRSPYGP